MIITESNPTAFNCRRTRALQDRPASSLWTRMETRFSLISMYEQVSDNDFFQERAEV
jgi:hypothetical protein